MGETAGTAASPNDPVLRCDGLVRRFGERTAVDGVSFAVAAGETYGLLGPNGAGKTTTISMVAGILRAHGGRVEIDGRSIDADHGAVKHSIGLVPQDIALYEDLTTRENLRFFGRLQDLGGKTLEARIDAVLDVVGLADRAGDRVSTISGGMKRRANIAVGMLHEPALLILDEPTVGVDPQSRNQILSSVEALGESGMAVLYTTHYMEEAERLCDRIGIMDGGRLVAEGTRAELVSRIGEHARIRVEASGDLAAFAARCRALPGVIGADVSDGAVEVIADSAASALAPVVEASEQAGLSISGVEVVEPDLEAVFLHLTGRALRD